MRWIICRQRQCAHILEKGCFRARLGLDARVGQCGRRTLSHKVHHLYHLALLFVERKCLSPPAPGTLHGWFLHPTDAVALTAAVLGEDPCASLPAAFTKGDNLQVLLVDRTVGRRLARPDVVKDYLSQKPYVSSVSLVTFRGGVGTLVSQARQAHASDVFIATHGAGNTNIAFMRPCSIFIELYPRLFYLPQYFGSLARQAGLLHFPIQVATNQSHGYASDRCITTMSKVTSNSDCFNDVACRRCARGVDSIDVSLDDIGAALEKGLIERTKCIKSSLYYSEIVVTTSR